MIALRAREIDKMKKMAIKYLNLFILTISLSACSAQSGKDTFKQNEGEYEKIAHTLLKNRTEMLDKSTCGVNDSQTISFTNASLEKCFSELEGATISEISEIFKNDLASIVYVKAEEVQFQIATKSDDLLTEFQYLIYSKTDIMPTNSNNRDTIQKIKPNWYFLKIVQDSY